MRENLYFHGRYFGMGARMAAQMADALLELFRLTDRADADVSTLSGGMAQRLMVARAVAHRPQVLFLDEPTSGLDPQSRLALWEIMRQIHREGQTVVLTTHYMEEADKLCDRVAIMDHGHILALDTPEGLRRSVGGDAVVRVQAGDEPDRLAAHLRDMDGVTSTAVLGETVQLTVHGSAGLLPRVIQVDGGRRVHRARRLARRADAGDGVHQPHREGPARMSGAAVTSTESLPEVGRRAARRPSPSGRCSCATSPSCGRSSPSSWRAP